MHGNSPKSLRQDLLRRRKEFAAGGNHAHTTENLIAKLNQFFTGQFKMKSIYDPLYWLGQIPNRADS
jgi:5-formyltetrahydrofolate cyclo-ligase